MALPVFRAAGAKSAGVGATVVAAPAGVATGDFEILIASTIAGATISITTAGGSAWGIIGPVGGQDVTGGERLYIWGRVRQAGDSDPTVTPSADHVCAGRLAYQAGTFDTTTFIEADTNSNETTSDTSFSWAPGTSTGGTDRLVLCVASNGADSNTGQVPVMTNASLSALASRANHQTNSGGGGGFGVTEGARAAAGALGTFACTMGTASPKAYIAFAIRPVPPPTPLLDQVAYRGRNDDGDETTATWKAAQNTAFTALLDTNFRLRFEVQETGGGTWTEDIQLEYRKNGGAWTPVAASGQNTQPVKVIASANFADPVATTNQLTAGTGSFVAGGLFDVGRSTITSVDPTITPNNHTENEWNMQFVSSLGAVVGDVYEFRLVVLTSNNPLNAYTVLPSVTVTSGSTPVAGSDLSGSGADASSLASALPGTDVQGATTEATTQSSAVPATDVQGATTESAAVAVPKAGTDASGGTTESATFSQLIAAADVSGVASEIAALLAAVSGSDLSGALSEATVLAVSVSGADASAAIVEAGSLTTRIAGTDVGASLELASLIATLAAADQLGTTQEATALRYFVLGTDAAGATTEQVAITFAILGADASGGSTETSLITAISHAVSDVGSGSDNAVITGMTVFLTVSDSGVGSDLATILAQRAASDVGTGIDTALSVVSQAGNDSSGSILEQAFLAANLLVSDLGLSLDAGVLKALVSGQDVGLGAEATTVGHYGSDSGVASDNAATTASLVTFDQISTIYEIASLVAFLAAQDESGEALELARAVLQGMLPAIQTGQIARVEGGRVASAGQPGSLSESSTGKVRSR